MYGIWIVLLLLFASALPVIILFFWYSSKKSPVTLPWFLLFLAAGIVSVFASAFIQNLLPLHAGTDRFSVVFFGVFIRIALVEEAGRLVSLIPLLAIAKRRFGIEAGAKRNFGASAGFAAGLGFAMLETVYYGMADINITLLRAFTAAPLHGACGIRAGEAVFTFRQRPVRAAAFFVMAVLVHGSYNLMIVSPALPAALSVLIAFTALASSLRLVKAP